MSLCQDYANKLFLTSRLLFLTCQRQADCLFNYFSDHLFMEYYLIVYKINLNRISLFECPIKDFQCEGIQYLSLQGPLQWPCSINLVKANLRKILFGTICQFYVNIFLLDIPLHPVHLYFHNLIQEFFGQGVKYDNLIYPVQEFRPEKSLHVFQNLFFQFSIAYNPVSSRLFCPFFKHLLYMCATDI